MRRIHIVDPARLILYSLAVAAKGAEGRQRRSSMALVAAIASAAGLVACDGGFSQPPLDTPPDEAIAAFVSAEGGLPAVAVAVIDRGETLYTKVAGVRKRGDSTPVTDADAFHIGSNTKAMTALIAGTAVDAGEISWDSTVADVLGGVIAVSGSYGSVTLDQLLSHTSGIPGVMRLPRRMRRRMCWCA